MLAIGSINLNHLLGPSDDGFSDKDLITLNQPACQQDSTENKTVVLGEIILIQTKLPLRPDEQQSEDGGLTMTFTESLPTFKLVNISTNEENVLITLRYLATGSTLQAVGDFTGIDKSTASSIIDKVVTTIARLRPQFVEMAKSE
ncbi:hypothetical protein JTB14_037790 [Gonioctena quinquepunctata]|nr:hypothetical protein JTB14_037790 [Gonioctena quinquepunctata]